MIYVDGKQYRVVGEKELVDELFKEIENKKKEVPSNPSQSA